MKTAIRIYLGLAALLCLSPVMAQLRTANTPPLSNPNARGDVHGRVVDAENQIPLEAANVYLDNTELGSSTTGNGEFHIAGVPTGEYTLVIQRIGYRLEKRPLTITPGKIDIKDIAISPVALDAGTVVVTAARKEQTVRMAPASVAVVRSEELAVRPVNTFDQVLESIPGLTAFRSAGTSVQSLSIRGSSDVAGGGVGNRVLLLIDGRPALTPDAGGAFWALVPISMIERVEVVKGAFSSLYGSTAMGGVVNVISRKPAVETYTRLGMDYGFYQLPASDIRYSDDTAFLGSATFGRSGGWKNYRYLFNLSHKQSDGHTQRSAYATTDVFFKSIYEATNQTTLELSLGGGFAKNDYPHTWLNSAHPLEVRPKFQDDRQEKRQFNTDFHLFGILDNGLRHSSRAYFYQTLAESYFNENDPFQEIPGNEVLGSGTRSLGQKLGVIEQFDFQFGQKDYWIAGADLQVDRVDAVPDSILYGKQQVNGFAVFLQNEYNITPRLTSTIGVRYDVNHLVGHKTLSALSPKVAFVYQFSEALTMRTLLGQAFRAPTIAERFFKVEQAGGILFDPNPDLDPERMTLSVETGFRWQPTVTVDLDLAVFRYHYEDLIYWVDIAGERGTPFPFFQVRNLNKALMQGLETTVTYRPLRQL
ncbi:MAG TPA: TonB-dependent receptor, partial [Calditrichia bacterium]|nr:TonB-dependent receptor [Calditrichia bacterium]